MPIATGSRLGAFEILSLLGAGGMGEVYKARDTRLERIVAIKVLPAHLADNPELRERFEREAKTIAGLNHPHICTLYDVGRQDGFDFLVMEYLEGETLAMRLLKGPLPIEQVLRYAIEISDALDRAHRNGVTHRDLKPGNVMLTKNGTKLLDFGLAKLKQEAAPARLPMSQLPTLSQNPTVQGMILGTLQYMSPELVEGRTDEIDGRTDIFAFGATVHEMATGQKAFEGRSSASLIGAILKDEPPPISSLLPFDSAQGKPMAPPALDRVVKKCLRKDPEERWQSARDVTDELKWIAEGGSQAGMAAPVVASRKSPLRNVRVAWSVAAVLLVAGLALGALTYLRRATAEQQSVRFSVGPPENATFATQSSFLSVSPDGSKLAFIASDSSGKTQLWIRELDSEAVQPLAGTDNPLQPFWSPDSRFLAFYADGKLKKVTVSGGPGQTLAEVPRATVGQGGGLEPARGSWSREGIVLFAPSMLGAIHRVSAGGGAATPVTALDVSRLENGHLWPHFLPDGNHFLYLALSANPENSAIYVGSLDSPERKLLLNVVSDVEYIPPGYLLFNREGTLMAQAFDAQGLELRGEAVPIAEGLQFNDERGRTAFAASQNGVLAYRTGNAGAQRRLVWVSRNGTEQPLTAPARAYGDPRLSPDDRRVAVGISGHVWLYDLSRETSTRLTFEGNENNNATWTPDGKHVALRSNRTGPTNIFWQLADGSGGAERLTTGEYLQIANGFSTDGQLLVFSEVHPSTGFDIWVLRLADRKAQPFLRTPAEEAGPRFSPDGRWLVYASNESGRREVYVRPYPGPGGKWLISTEGGREPMWNRNGQELFYRNAYKMMAVDVMTQPTFSAGKPRVLFEGRYRQATPTYPQYDVTADGQRFLMLKDEEQQQAAPAQISVVVNWIEDMKRRMPAGE